MKPPLNAKHDNDVSVGQQEIGYKNSDHQLCSLTSPISAFHLEIKVPGCGERLRRPTWLTESRGVSGVLSILWCGE